jgi:hypothetical protein
MPKPGPGRTSRSLAAEAAQLTPPKKGGQVTYSWGTGSAQFEQAFQPGAIFSQGDPLPPILATGFEPTMGRREAAAGRIRAPTRHQMV